MSSNVATFETRPAGAGALERVSIGRYTVPLGRLFFAAIFLITAPAHFSAQTIAYAAQAGVPLATLAVPLSGVIAALGGLSILLGYRARIGALLIVIFLIPVTLTFHDFWTVTDRMMAQLERAMFFKNLGLLGGALLIAHFGAGPVSVDERSKSDTD